MPAAVIGMEALEVDAVVDHAEARLGNAVAALDLLPPARGDGHDARRAREEAPFQGQGDRVIHPASSHVRVVGEIPFDDVPRYLVAADVVAVPQRATSDTQGQVPAKLFDAMALARPVVSTAVSMIPEILDGCGLVIPPGDVRALAAALQQLLGDRATAEALGRRARARCEELYSFAAARRRLYPLVERAVAGQVSR